MRNPFPYHPSEKQLWKCSIAKRVLPNVADAEDAVQEAYVRLLQTREVHSLEGFLVRTTIRRCIDRLREKRTRDKNLRPSTLCSAIATVSGRIPETGASLHDAFLFMLERLTPGELTAYVLRTVFNYDHVDIARILNKTEANGRQIFHRAQSRVRNSKARFDPAPGAVARLVDQFVAACRTGDVDSIVSKIIPNTGSVTRNAAKLSSQRLPTGFQEASPQRLAQLQCGSTASRVTAHRFSRSAMDSSCLRASPVIG
ncbi:sigma factor [Caulifigura coniformis]|uniref:sigma factor n=1 Tax=Caulifigura coniformis TaxID=2527983 RepID=UPI00119CA1D2|nr:sigma factor [Caulifigura coniformis]